MDFPISRPRRLRYNPAVRRLVAETRFSAAQLIHPLFIRHGQSYKSEISSMPGQYQLSVDESLPLCEAMLERGLGGTILFGIPEEKDQYGSDAYAEDGVIQNAVRTIKDRFPELLVITDLCLCEYTDHGHCGVLADNDVDNDSTLELLAKAALAQAQAGSDVIAPSDMMDGRVAIVREALDENHYEKIPILSYAAKYASGFYGPFRDAAGSTPQSGDRKSYQMAPPNALEALKEVQMDIEEGADMVMVKPALAYLDVVSMVKDNTAVPVAAYNVSGEYSLVKAAAKLGWLDEQTVRDEMLTSIFRAGADFVITYFALDVGKELKTSG